jgi:transposase
VKELVARDPEAIHIMIWDRAGFHPKADSPELSESIRLLPLPAYSPELNPVESLWDPVKRRIANDVWETLENIEAAISEVLEPFWRQVEQVQSLLGDSWLTRGVATFLDRRKRLIST